MIRRCEAEAIKIAVHEASDGKINIEPADMLFGSRTGNGNEHFFYLRVDLVRPIEASDLRYLRFHANFLINGLFHPFNLLVGSDWLELEKWDERELLPSNDDFRTIALEGIEGF